MYVEYHNLCFTKHEFYIIRINMYLSKSLHSPVHLCPYNISTQPKFYFNFKLEIDFWVRLKFFQDGDARMIQQSKNLTDLVSLSVISLSNISLSVLFHQMFHHLLHFFIHVAFLLLCYLIYISIYDIFLFMILLFYKICNYKLTLELVFIIYFYFKFLKC